MKKLKTVINNGSEKKTANNKNIETTSGFHKVDSIRFSWLGLKILLILMTKSDFEWVNAIDNG